MPGVDDLETVIALKLSEALLADTSHQVSQHGQEERREMLHGGCLFEISRGHAYRDHATGPATNPRFAGADKSVERWILDDAIVRIKANNIPKVTGIASPGTGVLVHGIPIRYNLIRINNVRGPDGFAYKISDYMVWQGAPDKLVKAA